VRKESLGTKGARKKIYHYQEGRRKATTKNKEKEKDINTRKQGEEIGKGKPFVLMVETLCFLQENLFG
jgi:hypothetical protein